MNRDEIEAAGYYDVEYQGQEFVVEAMWPSLTFEDAWLVSRVDNGRTFVLPTKNFLRRTHAPRSQSRNARRWHRHAEVA
jgi:hypothetical protein